MWKDSTRSCPKIKAISQWTLSRCVSSLILQSCVVTPLCQNLNFVVECTNRLSCCALASVRVLVTVCRNQFVDYNYCVATLD